MRNLSCAFVAIAVLSAARADADDYNGHRENSLRKDYAVRHRRLLVKNRFEFTPLFESSINADFNHIVGGGAKLEYHLSDMWSIGVVGVGSTAIHTSLVNRLTDPNQAGSLSPGPRSAMNPLNQREPTIEEFLDHINTIPFHGAAYISLTPWYGKLAAFSSAFVAFDFYFQAGVAFALLNSSCPTNVCSDTHPGVPDMSTNPPTPPILNPNLDPPLNDGARVGLYLGGGIHVFLNDFLALDLTVRDYWFSDNPSGTDYNADLFVSEKDSRFLHHLYFGAGLSLLLPTTVKRTP